MGVALIQLLEGFQRKDWISPEKEFCLQIVFRPKMATSTHLWVSSLLPALWTLSLPASMIAWISSLNKSFSLSPHTHISYWYSMGSVSLENPDEHTSPMKGASAMVPTDLWLLVYTPLCNSLPLSEGRASWWLNCVEYGKCNGLQKYFHLALPLLSLSEVRTLTRGEVVDPMGAALWRDHVARRPPGIRDLNPGNRRVSEVDFSPVRPSGDCLQSITCTKSEDPAVLCLDSWPAYEIINICDLESVILSQCVLGVTCYSETGK